MLTTSLSPARRKVLVVDDDPVILELVRERLEEAGYEVEVREVALGTTQYVADKSPDVVLLDVKMPALSGTELAQLLRKNRATSGAVVILHSSLDTESLEALVAKTGAAGALRKDASEREFLNGFTELAGRSRVAKR